MVIDAKHTLSLLWAKSDPFHSVPCHCIDVGAVAQVVLEAPAFRATVSKLESAVGLSTAEGLSNWIGYLFALHDYGKCEPHFQGKCPELTKPLTQLGLAITRLQDCEGYRHESVSADFLSSELERRGWGRKARPSILNAIKAHHGNFTPRLHDRAPEPAWQNLQNELHQTLETVFQPTEWAPQSFPHLSQASMLLCGLLVLSDWIASNAELFGLQHQIDEDYPAYADRAKARARECLQQMKLYELPETGPVQSFTQVWKGFDPRGLQTECETLLQTADGPGLLLAEAPMGEGKSELAVYAALRMTSLCGGGGFYIALPTSATSNQMFGRIQSFVQNFSPEFAQSVRLAHGSAWLVDSDEVAASTVSETNDESASAEQKRWAAEWFRPRRRSLLSPFAVGTVDQAMMAALNVKFGFLRWLGLSNGALIIDEVHAYDSFMRVILKRLLAWCGSLRIPVVLLSATLPRFMKTEFVSAYLGRDGDETRDRYPLLSFYPCQGQASFSQDIETTKTYELQTVPLEGALDDCQRLADTALQEVAEGGCLCLLMNTVGGAQQVYALLQELVPEDVELSLFHARFKACDRERLENEVLDRFDKRSSLDHPEETRRPRPTKAILVATQVVEQSLDIDFDVMISQLAPIDLLLQRSGRVHRHRRDRPARHQRPRLLIATAAESRWGSTGKVYQPLFLLKTSALLPIRAIWRCPDDFRELIESVYTDGSAIEAVLDRDELEEAKASYAELQAEYEQAGSLALIRPPLANKAGIVHETSPPGEEDGASDNKLVAATRYGNDSVTVYALTWSPAMQKLMESERPPRKSVRKELMKAKVSLHQFWLSKLQPADGFLMVQQAPKWLGFGQVLWMVEDRWWGRDEKGRLVTIGYDKHLGFQREVDR